MGIQFERPNKSKDTKKLKSLKSKVHQQVKTSPKIKTTSVNAECTCNGENEKCFKCHGTGFYQRTFVENMSECHDRVQEKNAYGTGSNQETQFSNDQRGGTYGIREQGRFSSNPLYEEDV
jgi:hypothetical protein